MFEDFFIRIKADISDFRSGMQEAKQEIDNTTSGMGDKFQDTGQKMKGVGKGLTKSLTLPIVGMGAGILNAGMNFESAMSEVSAISGATGDDFDALRDQAMELGEKTKFSASDAADGMKFLSMAGFETNDVLDSMPGLLSLASASGMELGNTADITSNIISGFGMEAEEAARVADVLAEGATSANTDVAQLGDAMKFVAPVASSLGISMENATAAVGVMSDAGIQGSMAGRQLRQGLLRLTKPTGEAADLIEGLGIEVFDANGQMKPLESILQELEDGMDGMSDQARSAALSTIFGAESMSGWSAMLDKGSGKISGFTKDLENSEGAAEEMSKIMMENAKGSIDQLKSAAEKASIVLSEKLIPIFTKIVEKITEWVRWFGNLNPATQKTIMIVAGLVAAIGPLLIVAGSVISSIGTIIKLFASVGRVISVAKVAFTALTGPIGLIGIAVAGLAFLIFKYWDEIKEVTAKVFGWLKEFLVGIWDGISEIWKSTITFLKNIVVDSWKNTKEKTVEIWEGIGDFLKSFFEVLKEVFLNFTVVGLFIKNWDTIKDKTIEIWNGIKEFFNGFFEVLKELFLNFTPAGLIIKHFNSFKEKTVEIWNGIKVFFSEFFEILKEIFLNFTPSGIIIKNFNTIKEKSVDIWNSIKEFFVETFINLLELTKESFSTIKNAVVEPFVKVKEKTVEIWESITEFFSKWFNAYIDQVTENFEKAKEITTKIFTDTVEVIKDVVKSVLDIGVNIVKGIWQGIEKTAEWLWDKVSGFGEMLVDTFKSILGINSPSTVFADTSEGIVTGIWKGISSMGSFIKDKIGGFASGMIDKFKGGLKNVGSIGSNIIKGIGNGMSNAKGWLYDKVGSFTSMIKDKFKKDNEIKSPSRVFAKLAEWIPKGVGEGIEDEEDEALNPIEAISQMMGELFDPELDNVEAPGVETPHMKMMNFNIPDIDFEALKAWVDFDFKLPNFDELELPKFEGDNITFGYEFDSSELDVESSLQRLKGKSEELLTNSKTDNTVEIELKGDLAPIVEEVKTNVGKDVSVKSSGRLI